MDLVLVHHFLILGHVADGVRHILEGHVLYVALVHLLALADHLLHLLVDLCHYLCDMTVSEFNPEFILVIQEHCFVIYFQFPLLRYVSIVVDDRLVVEVVHHRCH